MENGHNGEGNGGFAIVNSASRVVTGQWVAHAQKTLHERAFEAADLVNGVSLLVRPTASQSAPLWRVNQSYVGWALKRQKERKLILSGVVPLVPPMVLALPKPADPAEQLANVVATVGFNGALGLLAQIENVVAIR